MKKQEILKKNYIIVALLSIMTLLGTFYLKKVYQYGNALKEEKSPLMEVTSLLNCEEFLNYVQENGDILLYYSQKYSKLEEDFASFIKEKEIKNVVYVENKNNEKDFLERLKIEYSNNIFPSVKENSSFLFSFVEGKIVDFLEINENTTLENIQIFLEKNGDYL